MSYNKQLQTGLVLALIMAGLILYTGVTLHKIIAALIVTFAVLKPG